MTAIILGMAGTSVKAARTVCGPKAGPARNRETEVFGDGLSGPAWQALEAQ